MLMDFSSTASTVYSVFEIITYVIIGICSLGFISQLFFFFLSFLKNKKLPKAKEFHKIAIMIPAHNESEVIGKSIDRIIRSQKYPKEYYDFFVCAHNCTDNTYNIAKEHGAIVYELNDPVGTQATLATPLRYLVNKIITEHKGEYDFIVKIDADNILDENFLSVMNDAYEHGYECCRGFIASSNLTQNNWTAVSGIYYMRDCRFSCRVREALHLDTMLDGGSGFMISTNVYEKVGGFLAKGISDDAELTLKLLYKRYRIHYVEDAIVYNDMPSTFKDTYNRNVRMGHGLNLLFWTNLHKMLGYGLFTGKISLLDMFIQLLFIPVSFLSLAYIFPYYVTILIFHALNAFIPGGLECMSWMTQAQSFSYVLNILVSGGLFILFFASFYIIQGLIVLHFAKHKLNVKSKKLIGGVFLSPLFMLLYNLFIFVGIVTIPKWKSIKRNVNNVSDIKFDVDKTN